jgi:IS5 family transposase
MAESLVVTERHDPPPADVDVIDSNATEEPAVGHELVPRAAVQSLIPGDTPAEVLEKAAQLAGPLAELIERQGLFQRIGQKKHVEIAGWQAMGAMLGALGGPALHAETEWVRPILDGDGQPRRTEGADGYDWHARVAVKTVDGFTVGVAESMCCRSEKTWRHRDDPAVAGMAETRAESRAYRRAGSWIITLAGYSPTASEEMPAQPASGAVPEPVLVEGEQIKQLGKLLGSLIGVDDHEGPPITPERQQRNRQIARDAWTRLCRITRTTHPTVETFKAIQVAHDAWMQVRGDLPESDIPADVPFSPDYQPEQEGPKQEELS